MDKKDISVIKCLFKSCIESQRKLEDYVEKINSLCECLETLEILPFEKLADVFDLHTDLEKEEFFEEMQKLIEDREINLDAEIEKMIKLYI